MLLFFHHLKNTRLLKSVVSKYSREVKEENSKDLADWKTSISILGILHVGVSSWHLLFFCRILNFFLKAHSSR
jgi:hypothetical protein